MGRLGFEPWKTRALEFVPLAGVAITIRPTFTVLVAPLSRDRRKLIPLTGLIMPRASLKESRFVYRHSRANRIEVSAILNEDLILVIHISGVVDVITCHLGYTTPSTTRPRSTPPPRSLTLVREQLRKSTRVDSTRAIPGSRIIRGLPRRQESVQTGATV